MAEGLRVVRGPDWNLGNEDKGEGHVGTVIRDNGDETYEVLWDMGGKSKCRVGKGGKYDLRVLDNAPIGVKHMSKKCEGCQKNTIIGVLWQCGSCNDVNLCTPCYFMDRHDLSHPFKRIEKPNTASVDVPKRSNSTKMRALGIFPGAKVIRGPNWDFGSQDGGEGKRGKVEDIRGYGSDVGGRNAVRVRWETSGEANVYRVGCRGKVDLQCVEEAPGSHYYREHLSVAGKTAKGGDGARSSSGGGCESILKKGDKCVVDMPEQSLKEVQRGHGGWTIRMAECVGEIVTVKGFPTDNTLEVEFKGTTYQLHASAVRKVHDVKLGDTVRVLNDERKAILLQKNHGGWNDDMKKSLGCVGKVVKIDSDGDVAVAFGNQAWVYSPGLLEPASGQKCDALEESGSGPRLRGESTSPQPSEGHVSLQQLMAHLVLLDKLGGLQTVGPQDMFNACAKGNANAVRQIISRKKELVNSTFKNLTPLMVAAYEGHDEIVKILVENGARINERNSDGNTPLLVALIGKEESCAIYLMQNKADVNASTNKGSSAVHIAVDKGLFSALRILLQSGAGPNKQDAVGDTPLHDAIAKRSDRGVAILLNHPQINLKILNKKEQIALMWAAMKDHEFAVEKILEKDSSLVNAANCDGHTALHIAAINGHTDSANILIMKGKARLNVKNKNGLTPLHYAALEGYSNMAKILILNGADLAAIDNDGDTPLHLALGGRRQTGGNDPFLQLLGLTLNQNSQNQERFNMATLMLDKGADYEVTNNKGNSPLQVCRNDQLRVAVTNYIQKTRGRKTNAAAVLQELFAELPIPCVACKEDQANTRLMPCQHKVLCVGCCFRFDRCPMCKQPVSDRCDLRGRRLEHPCHVQ